ncbi:MAG TPA: lysylphosphatidylglycerol synthase transmembrane domain-containing protein [Planctomycetota bacterium]|nr:lysylphosphatidylglycerol synthase transmembrane domain-containing protein [Planctomycetota bacterium]
MWKKVAFACSLLLGVGLFAFFIGKFGGVEKSIQIVAEVGWLGLVLFVLNAALVPAAPAVGWTMLMRAEGLKVPVWTALKAAFMGFPINFIAPSMYLGAEPLKVIYVANAHDVPKRRVLATIIVSKVQEVGALLFVMLCAAAIALWRIDFKSEQRWMLVGGMAVLTVCFGLGIYAFLGNFKPTVKFINLLARFGFARRKLARLRTHAHEVEHIIQRSMTKGWRTFIASQAVTLISAVSILLRPWIFFVFAKDLWLGTEVLCAVYVVTNLINMVPHTPGGLGIFEGGMLGLFALLDPAKGQPEQLAAGFSIITRAADVVLILVGIVLIFVLNMRAFAKSVAKGEQKLRMQDAAGAVPAKETRKMVQPVPPKVE